MKVTFLGTAAAIPTKERSLPAICVSHESTSILLDCGEGTQKRMLEAGISLLRIDAILITHLHGDHFFGCAGLCHSMSLLGRDKSLEIYGPSGIKKAIKKLLTAGEQRVNYSVEIKELKPEQSLSFGKLIVKIASADHTIPALAYRVETEQRPGKFNDAKADEIGLPKDPLRGKLVSGEEIEFEGQIIKSDTLVGPSRKGSSLVYSGDSRASKDIEILAQNVDLLIHEATLIDKDKAQEFGHSTPKDAAMLARKAKVGKLVLTHSSQRHTSDEILAQAKDIFGETVFATDLMIIDL